MVEFVKGEAVEQVLPAPIKGTVLGFGFDPDTGNVTVLVGYTAADGTEQQRYFQQSELVAISAEEAAEATAAE